MADDEFDDDIDWSSIEMPPTPAVTPGSNKRPRLDHESHDDDEPSLLQNLEMAPTFNVTPAGEDEQDNAEEVGDALQLKAIELATKGENLFLTGKAGTGKSWATKRIVKSFNDDDKIIHVTAPTGIAAINIGGMTIHSWGRFQLGQYYEDFNNMMSEDTMKKIRKMDALLIDEISMLDGQLFDVLECMITIIRTYDDDVSHKIKQIKQWADSGNTIMSETMLRMRWDTASGFGDLPPFGGLQLIVVGDFYQLPPVPNSTDVLIENEHFKKVGYDLKIGRQGSYAFESNAWQRSSFQTVELTQIHRQAEKDGLFEFLNAMREGEPDLVTKHEKTLTALQTPLPPRYDGIIPTELHSKNYVVDRRNQEELLRLPGDTHEFVSLDEVDLVDEIKQKILASNGLQHLQHLSIQEIIASRELPWQVAGRVKKELNIFTQYAQENFFEKDCRVAHNIELKEDAQVMLLWNLDFNSKLANGSRGVVKGFFPSKGYYHLIEEEIRKRKEEMHGSEESEDQSSGESKAISDCKSDGLAVITPNKASKDASLSSSEKMTTQKMSHGFDFSHVDKAFLKEIKDHVANMGPAVIAKEMEGMMKVATSNIVELPYIHFANGKRRIIRPQPFSKEFKDIGTATRWQIPLTLAWAISIHKSQGMTIELLYVDLTDCFAIGQAYVATSRGVCLNSMTVKNFKPSEIKTSSKVKSFYISVNSGKSYTGGTWADTIQSFDEDTKRDMEKKKDMKRHYNNVTPCQKCGTMCVVGQIKTNRNNNQGKFFISCPASNGEHGHTWELVNTVPLKSASESSSQQFKILTPGVDGAIKGRLEDKRFVATGVFPELGGGFGLKIGRDKLKEMIESFGGKITTGISGRTNYVIFGDEPGAKRLDDAKSKGIPIIDRTTLLKILVGEAELPPSGEDETQPTIGNFFKAKLETDRSVFEC